MSVWRVLRYALLLLVLAVAAVVLSLRYYFLPRIDDFRSQILTRLEQQLDLRLDLDYIAADWKGLNPSLELSGLLVRDASRQHVLLRLPTLSAKLSWRSLLRGQPVFRYVHTEGLQLDVRRDKQGQWWIVNQALEGDSNADSTGVEPFLMWLGQQRHIRIANSQLRWLDETTQAAPLVLQQVHLEILNRGNRHQVQFNALPPPDLGQAMALQLTARSADHAGSAPLLDLRNLQGRLHLDLSNIDLMALEQWLELPTALRSARAHGQASLEFSQGRWGELRTEVLLNDVRWHDEQRDGVLVERLRVYTEAAWDDYLGLLEPALHESSQVQVRLQAHNVYGRLAWLFQDELSLQDLAWEGELSHSTNTGWQVLARRLRLKNADLEADLQGHWQQQESGTAGYMLLSGQVPDLSLVNLVNYLPRTLSADALDWMRSSLLAGRVRDAQLHLEGALDDFPFGERPEQGQFTLAGDFDQVLMDYLPASKTEKGWPRLELPTGKVSLQNAQLSVRAERGLMPIRGAQNIVLTDLQADIANLERQSVLELSAQSQAPASSYLGLMPQTPLGGLLGNVFDQAQGQGNWTVPLSLSVPLLNSLDTQVKGSIQFSGADLRLMPEAPWLRGLQGELHFTERGVTAQRLQGNMLGGPVSIRGRMEPGAEGLRLQGSLSAPRLGAYVDSQALRRLQGELSYESVLRLDKQAHFGMDISSTLVGLEASFPAPMSKSAATPMPLQASWYADADGAHSWLDIRLDTEPVTEVRLQRRSGQDTGPFFRAVSVLAGQQGAFPESGIVVDGQYKRLDLDAWNRVLDEFSVPWEASEASQHAEQTSRPVLPAMQRSRVQVQRGRLLGMGLDQLTFTSQESVDGTFRVDISSAQTAGTIRGKTERRKPVGRWDIHFNRLSLGRKEVELNPQDRLERERFLDISEDIILPDIDVRVDRLTLYEREVGALKMVGKALNQGRQWELEQLQLSGQGLQLEGKGYWQLRGPQRGLHLETEAQIQDLGAYLEQLGAKDVLSGGRGQADMNVFWHDFPWSMERSALGGKLSMNLQKGRFSQVGSRSARLLELLSLQSLSRIMSFNFNPAGLFEDGFPFDEWKGSLDLQEGVLSARDYKVAGPVGLIELEGYMQVQDETLHATASVYPRVDVSGAAVAAGVMVNPFLGLGTFLAQWLLREPLSQGMAVRYRISGSLDEPHILELDSPKSSKREQATPLHTPY